MSPEAAKAHALACISKGNFAEAEATYRNVLKTNPEDSASEAGLGIALKQQGQLEEAKTRFCRALEINPRTVEALTNLISPVPDREPQSRRNQRAEIADLFDWLNATGPAFVIDVVLSILLKQLGECQSPEHDAEAMEISELAATIAPEESEHNRAFKALQTFYANPDSRLIDATLTDFVDHNEGMSPIYLCARLNTAAKIDSFIVTEHQKAVRYPSSTLLTDSVKQFRFKTNFTTAPAYLTETTNATITENFMVIADNGDLISEDFTPFPIKSNSKVQISAVFTEILRIREEAALLKMKGRLHRIKEPCVLISGGPDGAKNYYHWMLDYLPRLLLAENASNLSDLKFIVNSDLSSFQQQTLEMLGISQNRLIMKDRDDWLTCDKLLIPSYLSKSGIAHPSAVEFLRRKFLPKAQSLGKKGPSRVYLSRRDSNTRKILNEAEVENVLREHQFEIIVPGQISVLEQIWSMASADIIVVAHGAALVNLVFAPVESQVLELVTKLHTSGLSIASCMRQPYRNLSAVPENPTDQDITVSIEDLKVALSKMLPSG